VFDGGRFFNFADDVIEYLGSNFIESAFSNATMHTHKRGNFLYRAIQSTGFGVYDMTDPLSPVTVYEHDYEEEDDYPYGISANGDYIFINDLYPDKTIHIHENGNDFSELGQIITDGNGVHRTATHGNLLYTTILLYLVVYNKFP
jgi:hypothetical protein